MPRPPRRVLLAAVIALISVTSGAIAWWVVRVDEVRADPATIAAAQQAPDAIAPDDWPMWRGPMGNGHAPSGIEFARGPLADRTRWATPIPGRGHASPIVVGDSVLVFTMDEADERWLLIDVDRASGAIRGTTELHRGGSMTKHDRNSHASATPASDGRHVVTAFAADGELRVVGVDAATGDVLWSTAAGPYASEWGYGSSPTIDKGRVFVLADSRGEGLSRVFGASHLSAIDARSGEILWRITRPRADSFGSPVVTEIAGREQVVVAGPEAVVAYAPETGDELWRCRWDAERTANTVAFDDGHVFASATIGGAHLLCIRADGSGDVTDTHVVWRAGRGTPDVPSPVVVDETLLTVTDDGRLTCFDRTTGRITGRHRLSDRVDGSPLVIGERVLVVSHDGTATLVDPKRPDEAETLGRVAHEDGPGAGVSATPALSRGVLYVRTETALIAIDATALTSPRSTRVANLPE